MPFKLDLSRAEAATKSTRKNFVEGAQKVISLTTPTEDETARVKMESTAGSIGKSTGAVIGTTISTVAKLSPSEESSLIAGGATLGEEVGKFVSNTVYAKILAAAKSNSRDISLTPDVVDAKNKNHAVIHMFNKSATDIMGELPRIASLGYTHILLSPICLSVKSDHWWARYQPLEYRMIGGPIGSLKDIENLALEAFTKYDISLMADVVFNHMATPDNNNNSFDYPQKSVILKHPAVKADPSLLEQYNQIPSDDKYLFTKADFFTKGKEFSIKDYSKRDELLYGDLGNLPDLNVQRDHVKQRQAEYLDILIRHGIVSCRIDAGKHLEEQDVNYIMETFKFKMAEYYEDNEVIMSRILCLSENITSHDVFCEAIAPYLKLTKNFLEARYYNSMELYDMCSFLKNPTSSTALQDYVTKGENLRLNISSQKGTIPHSQSLNYVCTHDICRNPGQMNIYIGDAVSKKIAYCLAFFKTKGGTPYVFLDDLKSSKDSGTKIDYCHELDNSDLNTILAYYQSIPLADRISANLFVDKFFAIYAISKSSFLIINGSSKYKYNLKDSHPPHNYLNCIQNNTYVDIFGSGIKMTIKHGRICEPIITFPPFNAFIMKRE